MTPEELTEIDRQVAEAIGDTNGKLPSITWVHDRNFHYHPTEGEASEHEYFRPSTDWNDAMLAADKAGIEELHLMKMTNGHQVRFFDEWGNVIFTGYGETAPLAICKAILSLKGKA